MLGFLYYIIESKTRKVCCINVLTVPHFARKTSADLTFCGTFSSIKTINSCFFLGILKTNHESIYTDHFSLHGKKLNVKFAGFLNHFKFIKILCIVVLKLNVKATQLSFYVVIFHTKKRY